MVVMISESVGGRPALSQASVAVQESAKYSENSKVTEIMFNTYDLRQKLKLVYHNLIPRPAICIH